MSETYMAEPEVAPTKHGRSAGRVVFLTVALLVVLALPVAAFVVYGILHGAGDQQDKLVPANVDFYAAAYLDPGVSQKLNLATIAHKFPDTKTDADIDKQITKALNDAFKDSGLDYTKDVKPWLGNQASIAVRIDGKDPRMVVLVATKDDKATQAAVDKARAHDTKETWHQSSHNGVTVFTGSDTSSNGPTSYALFDHVLVLSNSDSFIGDLIDVNKDPGHHAALHDSADYKAAMAKLPSERLAVAYANAPSLIGKLKEQLKKDQATAPLLSGGQLDQLDAYRAVGIAIAAKPDGVLTQVEASIDSSKLSADVKSAMAAGGHANNVLKYIPAEAYGTLAFGQGKAFGSQLQKMMDGLPAETKSGLDQVGLSDPNGIIKHLSGDLGIDVESSSSQVIPAGSLLVGTDDKAVARQFLDKISGFLTVLGAGSAQSETFTQINNGLDPNATTSNSTPSSRPATPHPPAFRPHRESYRGVEISSVVLPAGSGTPPGIAPAWAVDDTGMIIISTSPAELKRLLDTHSGSSNISTSSGYHDAVGDAGSANAVFYLDIQRVVSAIRDAIPAGSGSPVGTGRADFDSQAARFAPVRSIGVSATSGTDHVSERIFVVIK